MGTYIEKYSQSLLDTHLENGKDWARSPRPRKLCRMMLAGGTAARDGAVDIFIAGEKIAHLENFFTTPLDKLMWVWHSSHLKILPNQVLSVVVTDAFGAADTFLGLDIQDL
jgi:hypothetical protein